MSPGDGLQTLHAFNGTDPADGAAPFAGLIEVGGLFYGTTENGGSNNNGTIFQMDTSTDPPTVTLLHSFDPNVSGEGIFPVAALVENGGVLYGTTQQGGNSGFGTIFSIETAGSNFTTYPLPGYPAFPYAALVKVGSFFYGTTQQLCSSQGGVLLGCGTVFQFYPASGEVQGVYFFTDGFMSPVAPLLLGSDGALYGTAEGGGANSAGAVFRLDVSSLPATATLLHHFNPATTGSRPLAGLIQINHAVYGTAWLDGAGGVGTVFKVGMAAPASAQVLHNFGPVLPNQVTAELTLSNGVFYGASHGAASTTPARCSSSTRPHPLSTSFTISEASMRPAIHTAASSSAPTGRYTG